MTGESEYGSVHHHTPTTTFGQWHKTWLKPSASASTSTAWWVATTTPLTNGCSSTSPLIPTPNRYSTSSCSASHHLHCVSSVVPWVRGSYNAPFCFCHLFVFVVLPVFPSRIVDALLSKCFGRFSYQKENFNFSPFKRKLKFHIFSCLKFYFKI